LREKSIRITYKINWVRVDSQLLAQPRPVFIGVPSLLAWKSKGINANFLGFSQKMP
jgi:hypothetical protein